MAITFNGISSGIDTAAIINATLSAQRVPISHLQSKKTSYNARISDLGQIASKLDALKSLAKDMAKTSNVLAFKVGVGDEKVLAATAEGETTAAAYEITVSQLARAEKDRSVGFGGDASQVKAGTLTLQTAGDSAGPYTIEIAEGDSLSDVVDKINASGAKVDASIVRDGSQSYLQIVASDSGHTVGGSADDAVTIVESYSGQTGAELGLTQVVQARNALLSIDGLPAESRKNRVEDIIPGLALDLKATGTSALTIASDKEGTKTKLKAFVDLANELVDLVGKATRTGDGARRVESDPALERLGVDIRSLVQKTVEGASGGTSSLARIGVQTDATGHLRIDDSKLDKALASDIRGVGRLFTQADSGLATTVQTLVTRYTDSVDGVIGNRKKALNARVDQLDDQIERMESRLERIQTSLQRRFTAMEKALQGYQAQGGALSSLYSG